MDSLRAVSTGKSRCQLDGRSTVRQTRNEVRDQRVFQQEPVREPDQHHGGFTRESMREARVETQGRFGCCHGCSGRVTGSPLPGGGWPQDTATIVRSSYVPHPVNAGGSLGSEVELRLTGHPIRYMHRPGRPPGRGSRLS